MENGADLPRRIGVYDVERELGAGGMGTVYLARSPGGRAVAVKVARPELASDPHFRRRFRAEVEAARRVGGFHTAPVVDADPDAKVPWLATAYVPGPTLAELIEREGPMDDGRLRALGAALAEALQAVHACGLVHRDLKPGNIIMAEDGPRVLDFGIARAVESTRLTATGAAFGTPGYLAPEQAQGEEVGGAADVFALGAVLVAAAGGRAFGTGTPMGLMYRSVHEPADLSALPGELRELVAACLSKDPAARPTPEALLTALGPTPDPAPIASPAAAPDPRLDPVPARDPAPASVPAPDPAPDPAPAPDPRLDRVPARDPALDSVPAPDPAPASVPDPVPASGPDPDTRVLTTPDPVRPASAGASRASRALTLAIVAVAVVGALGGGLLALTQLGDKDDKGAGPSITASGPSTASESPQASSPPSTPAPSRASAAPKDRVTVVLTGTVEGGKSWVSVKGQDGTLLYDGLLDVGETKTFTDKNQITLVLGNAHAVQLVVNGKQVPNDFQPGQVERLTYGRGD
ncbi:RodZ domain-containing protein [Streptomyces sp. NPDC015661]|uniref:RodZ domain-containing protein n=1 Tax=Streptomyces sp. NPDC015661 TaxID=3364961 RepID=UPI0036FCB164